MAEKIKMLGAFRFLFEPKRYKICYSGRGTGKSYAFAQALLIRGARERLRILCVREFQGSIKDSVHRLLCDQIEAMGLQKFYEVTQHSITGLNGTSFIFEGIRNNVTKIKSMEGIDVAWLEEAENISEYSYEVLIPTIRKKGSELWVSFNPRDETDSTYDQFVTPYIEELSTNNVYEDDTVYVKKVFHSDNPFFPEELRLEMEKCKKDNYNKYLHIWMGEPNADYEDAIIKPEWIEAAIDAHIKLKWEIKGLVGMGLDPADQGNDAKAYCVRHGPLVTHCANWTEGDLEEGVRKAYMTATEIGVTDICYDVIGIGAGAKIVFNQLSGNSSIDFQAFNGASSPDKPDVKYKGDRKNADMFRNKRAQYYWYLRDRFEATYRAVKFNEWEDPEGLISLSSDLPHLKQLRGELARIQRKHGRTESMSIQIESKQDMKARGLKSPNLADALVYCFATKIRSRAMSKHDNWDLPIN